MQGGLKIPIRVKAVWPLVEKLSIYITKVEEIKYPVTREYVDDSKEILKDLVGPKAIESLDDDEDDSLAVLRMKTLKIMRLLNSLYCDISFLVDLV